MSPQRKLLPYWNGWFHQPTKYNMMSPAFDISDHQLTIDTVVYCWGHHANIQMGEIPVHGDDNHLPDIPHGHCHGQWSCHHHHHQWLCQHHEHTSKLACNHPDEKVRAHHENKEMSLTFNVSHHCKMMHTVVHCQIHHPCPHVAALPCFHSGSIPLADTL